LKIISASFQKGMHLNEQDLLPEKKVCIFCSGKNLQLVGKLQDSPEINLLMCSTCHAVSASRIPKKQILKKYYEKYYSDTDNHQMVTFDTPYKLSSHIYKVIYKHIENMKMISILDFGGGWKYFNKFSKEIGKQWRKKSYYNYC